jgi:NAD-dependent dihydropyrimidine dehydrogenase PreA subunit
MARVITDDCVKCGTCAANCPVNAISEGDSKFNIDKDTCIDCGACEADCPSSAIKAE